MMDTDPTASSFNTRQNVKRAIQVLVPGVPAPVVDYAVNSPFFASILAPGGNVSGGVRRRSSTRDLKIKPTFVLREMDSGDWGEHSLTSPVHRKYHNDTKFTDASHFNFDLTAPQQPEPKKGRR